MYLFSKSYVVNLEIKEIGKFPNKLSLASVTKPKKPMLNDVEFYVKHGTTNVRQKHPPLRAKFSNHPNFKKDLYNAIQKFKVGQKDTIENDAVNLPEWFFEFRLSEEDRILISFT
ncbi:5017_t:CDS:2 [Funneliformis geosporum]|uniref:15542_t:CDS:1 n=1 Tax=Funneliformis geosporum TaxID=1117311 RepID=A0A9W4SPY8_9GLOM|nr:5017_t:CDS:2 [Funneliformis geosporum]CAI2176598.1 15542_t:CDS:2 [Funneliformis geosporum]